MRDILGLILGPLILGVIVVALIKRDISSRNESKLVNIQSELKDLEEKYLD